MGLAAGDAGAALAAAFYAAHHVLVKGALFLAVGVVAATGRRRLWPTLLPAAVLALGLGGLPLTGGALAKLAVKRAARRWRRRPARQPLGGRHDPSHAAFHPAGCHGAHRPERVPFAGLAVPWQAIALAAMAVPWLLYPTAEALTPTALWDPGWPVLLGAGLAVPLHLWGRHLPGIPEGDLVVLYLAATRRLAGCGDLLVRLEAGLRRWPVAGVLPLALTLALGAAFLAG